MQKRLLYELQSNFSLLSNAEKKIATAILQNPKKFTGYSLIEAAEIAGVSQGSVVNFAKKLTDGGFPTLKMQIAASIAATEEEPFSVISETDTVKDVFQKTAENVKTAFTITAAKNKEDALQGVAERILRAKRVLVFGIGSSTLPATYLRLYLLRLGVSVSFVQDPLYCAVSAVNLTPNDLFFAISSSGRTKDVLDAARYAKASGVPVVAMTSNKGAPIVKLADEVLYSSASGSSVVAKDSEIVFSQLALCETICAYLRTHINADDKNGESSFNRLRKIFNLHNVED